MVKSKFARAAYTALLILVLFIPVKAWSGSSVPTLPIPTTLNASYQLFFFWDLRNRESFFQVYNTDPVGMARVHIQIFDVANNCRQTSFFDTFTRGDTHVYNLRNLDTNDGLVGPLPLPDNGYGLIAVTLSDADGNKVFDPVLIGNFRIVDESGYEYRTNAASFPPDVIPTTSSYSFNFNNVDGTKLSDVVGMPIFIFGGAGPGIASVVAAGTIGITFDAVSYDDFEHIFSCPPVAFACDFEDNLLREAVFSATGPLTNIGFDLGINGVIPNSRGELSICPTNTDTKGLVTLTVNTILTPAANFFVGFVGLNNGDGTGSMEPFTASPP